VDTSVTSLDDAVATVLAAFARNAADTHRGVDHSD